MILHLDLDEKLVGDAMRLGGHRTKRAAVTQALVEYMQQLFGNVEIDPKLTIRPSGANNERRL